MAMHQEVLMLLLQNVPADLMALGQIRPLLEQQPRPAALFLWNLGRELSLREATGTSASQHG